MVNMRMIVRALLFVTVIATAVSPTGWAQTITWTRQFGSSADDVPYATTVDSTGVYVVGVTEGTLSGQTRAGGVYDAFIQKRSTSGGLLWTRQFGTLQDDYVYSVAVDSTGVYVVGATSGALPGQTSKGSLDAFVRKYSSTGQLLWTRQFGTASSDNARAVTVTGGSIYITGDTSGALSGQTRKGGIDAYVRKLDAYGNHLWTRQLGTGVMDVGRGISANGTGVYLTGYTNGALPGQTRVGGSDAFVIKYSASGSAVWTRQFGTLSGDRGFGVKAYGSYVYVTGDTGGSLPGATKVGRGADGFLRKYTTDGAHVFTRQFGVPGDSYGDESSYPADVFSRAIDADSYGVYVAGYANGAIVSPASPEEGYSFVRKYGTGGGALWTRQFAIGGDGAEGIVLDSSGVYVAGTTRGTLPGQTAYGLGDGYVRKYAR